MAEIPISVNDRNTLLHGQAFGGVIGGILRTEQGDVLGKWPLAFLDEDSLRDAREFGKVTPGDGLDPDFEPTTPP